MFTTAGAVFFTTEAKESCICVADVGTTLSGCGCGCAKVAEATTKLKAMIDSDFFFMASTDPKSAHQGGFETPPRPGLQGCKPKSGDHNF
jgi:hypothetical protein